jgi:type II secretory ATPase GspE/PulE/Tfp pilus assembly ATPase PilB-like protein
MNAPFLLAEATTAILVNWWIALIGFIIVLGWARLVSTVLDKDAAYYHLPRRKWNMIYMGCLVLAIAAIVGVPIIGVNLLAAIIILAAPVFAYMHMRNNAVPESERRSLFNLNIRERMEERRIAKATREAIITFVDSEKNARKVPMKDEELFPIHMLAEDLIAPAIQGRASRVELLLTANGTQVMQVVDGVRYNREPIPVERAPAVIDYLRDIAGMDVKDRRRRQLGRCRIAGSAGTHELTITFEGSSTAQRLRIDIDLAERLVMPFDQLGLLPSQLELLKSLKEVHDRHGIVLLGAPHGQGLTTLAYSAINRHDAYTSNIKILEHESLTHIEGVDHVIWDPSNPAVDFATNLQSILRRDPDIVLIDELRDKDTAGVAAGPGIQGPLLYIPQRLDTIADQLRDWITKVGDARQATRPLRAVVNVRLLRKLCPKCRQAYQPSPEQIKRLNLPASAKQLYQAGGKVQVKNKIETCPVCQGSGYLGQTGAYEVLLVTDEVRKQLEMSDVKSALAEARRNKMLFLQEAALSKMIAGETSLEEVIRVTAARKAEGKPPSTQTAASAAR